MRFSPAVCVLLLGCSSGSGAKTTPTTSATAPAVCDPSQRAGTYLVHYDIASGNCGAVPDTLVILPPPPMSYPQSTCTVLVATLSDGNCRQDTQEQCSSGISLIGYTVQQAADGSRISGEFSITQPNCAGTYLVAWTRQ